MGQGNPLKELLTRGGTGVGAACSLGSAHAVEIIAHSDLDFVYIDMQHGQTSPDLLTNQLRAFGGTMTAPLVRVMSNQQGLIGQALDAGAFGVIVPMINTVADAQEAVDGCYYPPTGSRSWGPLRAAFGLGTDPSEVNDRVLCFAMVETQRGIDNVLDIVQVPGIDGIYIGPADLGVSMGLRPRMGIQAGAHAEAIDRIVEACQSAGKVAGMSGTPADLAARGFRLITAMSDVGTLTTGLREAVERRAALGDRLHGLF